MTNGRLWGGEDGEGGDVAIASQSNYFFLPFAAVFFAAGFFAAFFVAMSRSPPFQYLNDDCYVGYIRVCSRSQNVCAPTRAADRATIIIVSGRSEIRRKGSQPGGSFRYVICENS